MTQEKENALEGGSTQVKFGPEAIFRLWTKNVEKIVRINELTARTIIETATRQLEFSQELLRQDLAEIRKLTEKGVSVKPADLTKIYLEHALQRVESLVVESSNVVNTAGQHFNGSLKLILHDVPSESEPKS
ncbi:hypothetical protein [Acidocella aminolytica]|uniref:Phasin domain-containing protein n=1 Tax=Acidocella aminolytica 101 = DSM 11237 TaxID=1120923 RepID=A0A0D6PHN7_9PROT|nr:hypothetical protein [Acidocella aminolytica]GAN80349.1 hypothetical protein Aam_045_023 [Acidocella aminolytica 101 = DSM 11237]GBQ42943.1 hypothetical protein AA11237_3120 [Acidocella aminolytica 101 = DSM 11237]SHE29643.1 hypothetical protein SAMN02746095_00042 [Acidocella aminolytica 101 = DSM 11237]